MIGISSKIHNYQIKSLKLFNNNHEIIKLSLKNFRVFIIGNIFKEKTEVRKEFQENLNKKRYKKLLSLNGEYFFIAINKKKNFLIFGNSENSYIPMFYTNDTPYLHLHSDIFKLNKKYFQEIDYKKIFEWLVYNGRSFDNSTFLCRIKCLEPGSIFILDKNKEKLIHGKVFSYKDKFTSIENATTKVSKSLREAVNLRISNTRENISFGLSGGLDSRILLSLIDPKNLKKVRSHTIGSKKSFEKEVSKKIANLTGVKHREITVSEREHYRHAENSVRNGGFNLVFQQGIVSKYYKKIKNKDQSNFFMMANALDVLIASSYSDERLKKISTKKNFIKWYKSKYQLFNLKELKEIFVKKIDFKQKKIDLNFNKFIKKINFNNDFINLNDALTFETRIKRWHNYTLGGYSRISNLLIPTYDQNFLKACSEIPSKYRFNDFFRKLLIYKINPDLSEIETSNIIVKKNLNNPDKKIHKRFYDVNLGLDMKKSIHFNKLCQDIKKELIKYKVNKVFNFSKIEEIIKDHKKNKKNNMRKIFMLITLLISFSFIYKIKQKNEL